VEHVGAKEETWADFIGRLPEKEYRYCVYDFKFTNADNMHIEKLTFINWNPDGAPLKKKVLYATGKESFKTYLSYFTKDITLTSRE
jgi:cofilin